MNKFEALHAREQKLMCHTYGRYPVSVLRAEGSLLWDVDGKQYVDLLAGIAVTSLGHCHPELAQCVAEQARKLWHVSNLFYQEEQLELAELLLSTCHMDKAFFCNSGAEANEAAIKLARRYMQRVKKRDAFEIITLTGCFHGRTLATVAATGQERFQDGFAPMPQGFVQVQWGDMDALRAAVTGKTAGILVEMIQGEGGIRPMDPAYIASIEKLCREKDILFISDEVQAGLCRSGRFWAFEHFSVKPDILTSAKALANGLPMGAMLATQEVSRGFVPGTHATTFGGNALTAAVACKTVAIMLRDHLAERAAAVGADFMDKTRALQKRLQQKGGHDDMPHDAVHAPIKEVRGLGLMLGIELSFDGQAVWEELLRRGFVCNLTQGSVLRLLPALTIEEEYLDAFLRTLEDILSAC